MQIAIERTSSRYKIGDMPAGHMDDDHRLSPSLQLGGFGSFLKVPSVVDRDALFGQRITWDNRYKRPLHLARCSNRFEGSEEMLSPFP